MPMHGCVIEDDAGARRILDGILDRSKGAFSRVSTYATAEEALQGIPDAPLPQVMLVDVSLPGISGVELTRRAKRSWPEVKIIIITGCTGLNDFCLAVKAGADGYLNNPFRPLEVVAAIEQVMSGSGLLISAVFSKTQPLVVVARSRALMSVITNCDAYLLALASDGMTNKEITVLTTSYFGTERVTGTLSGLKMIVEGLAAISIQSLTQVIQGQGKDVHCRTPI